MASTARKRNTDPKNNESPAKLNSNDGVASSSSPDSSKFRDTVLAQDGRVFFPCRFCSRAFTQRTTRAQHVEVCPAKNYIFSVNNSLSRNENETTNVIVVDDDIKAQKHQNGTTKHRTPTKIITNNDNKRKANKSADIYECITHIDDTPEGINPKLKLTLKNPQGIKPTRSKALNNNNNLSNFFIQGSNFKLQSAGSSTALNYGDNLSVIDLDDMRSPENTVINLSDCEETIEIEIDEDEVKKLKEHDISLDLTLFDDSIDDIFIQGFEEENLQTNKHKDLPALYPIYDLDKDEPVTINPKNAKQKLLDDVTINKIEKDSALNTCKPLPDLIEISDNNLNSKPNNKPLKTNLLDSLKQSTKISPPKERSVDSKYIYAKDLKNIIPDWNKKVTRSSLKQKKPETIAVKNKSSKRSANSTETQPSSNSNKRTRTSVESSSSKRIEECEIISSTLWIDKDKPSTVSSTQVPVIEEANLPRKVSSCEETTSIKTKNNTKTKEQIDLTTCPVDTKDVKQESSIVNEPPPKLSPQLSDSEEKEAPVLENVNHAEPSIILETKQENCPVADKEVILSDHEDNKINKDQNDKQLQEMVDKIYEFNDDSELENNVVPKILPQKRAALPKTTVSENKPTIVPESSETEAAFINKVQEITPELVVDNNLSKEPEFSVKDDSGVLTVSKKRKPIKNKVQFKQQKIIAMRKRNNLLKKKKRIVVKSTTPDWKVTTFKTAFNSSLDKNVSKTKRKVSVLQLEDDCNLIPKKKLATKKQNQNSEEINQEKTEADEIVVSETETGDGKVELKQETLENQTSNQEKTDTPVLQEAVNLASDDEKTTTKQQNDCKSNTKPEPKTEPLRKKPAVPKKQHISKEIVDLISHDVIIGSKLRRKTVLNTTASKENYNKKKIETEKKRVVGTNSRPKRNVSNKNSNEKVIVSNKAQAKRKIIAKKATTSKNIDEHKSDNDKLNDALSECCESLQSENVTVKKTSKVANKTKDLIKEADNKESSIPEDKLSNLETVIDLVATGAIWETTGIKVEQIENDNESLPDDISKSKSKGRGKKLTNNTDDSVSSNKTVENNLSRAKKPDLKNKIKKEIVGDKVLKKVVVPKIKKESEPKRRKVVKTQQSLEQTLKEVKDLEMELANRLNNLSSVKKLNQKNKVLQCNVQRKEKVQKVNKEQLQADVFDKLKSGAEKSQVVKNKVSKENVDNQYTNKLNKQIKADDVETSDLSGEVNQETIVNDSQVVESNKNTKQVKSSTLVKETIEQPIDLINNNNNNNNNGSNLVCNNKQSNQTIPPEKSNDDVQITQKANRMNKFYNDDDPIKIELIDESPLFEKNDASHFQHYPQEITHQSQTREHQTFQKSLQELMAEENKKLKEQLKLFTNRSSEDLYFNINHQAKNIHSHVGMLQKNSNKSVEMPNMDVIILQNDIIQPSTMQELTIYRSPPPPSQRLSVMHSDVPSITITQIQVEPFDRLKAEEEILSRTCTKCVKVFNTVADYQGHVTNGHRYPKIMLPAEEVVKYFEANDRSHCPLCGKEILSTYKSVFVKHLKTHIHEAGYVCRICGAKFRRIDAMKAHEKRHIVAPPPCN